MGPLDAARAVALLQPRVAVPIHWGTLSPMTAVGRRRPAPGEPPELFAEHVARLAPDVEVRILAPGTETRAVLLGWRAWGTRPTAKGARLGSCC